MPSQPTLEQFVSSSSENFWCAWRDLNPHDRSHCILSAAWLPITPQAHILDAPRGFEPRFPDSESGVLPDRRWGKNFSREFFSQAPDRLIYIALLSIYHLLCDLPGEQTRLCTFSQLLYVQSIYDDRQLLDNH